MLATLRIRARMRREWRACRRLDRLPRHVLQLTDAFAEHRSNPAMILARMERLWSQLAPRPEILSEDASGPALNARALPVMNCTEGRT